MRWSYLFILSCLSLSHLGCSGCAQAPDFWIEAKPGQKKVLVSFPPLYAITHAVAGDDAYVLSMLTTEGPHGYHGAATDLFRINKADLLISNGLELDDAFVNKMLRGHSNGSLVTLNIGESLLATQPALVKKGDGKWCVHADGTKHKLGEFDPHLWLGPPQAKAMTRLIAAKLSEIDPAHKAGYEERAAKFIAELEDVENQGKKKLHGKANKKLVTMHEAFAYFASAFDLEIARAIQKNPGVDPDPVSVKDLVELCQAVDGPRVIAVEPQFSTGQADALKASLKNRGVLIKIVTLDPLETAEIPAGRRFNPDPRYFIDTMRKNIETLAEALP
ncbi:MAG: zinc ABC transporter substrate-binding protein [Planctomycetes bacterium]|nr:zinc ABC transporter substrate-binding protein [Planctomycetota bacterium]